MIIGEDVLLQKVPLQPFYRSSGLNIFTTASNYAQWNFLKDYVSDSTVIIYHDWTYQFNCSGDYWKKLVSDDLPENFIFLSNDIKTHQTRLSSGLNSYLVNQNCFINEDIFKIIPGVEKRYYGVMCSRAKDWKRIGLAARLNNLALIINRWNIESHRGENDDAYKDLRYSYLNSNMLSPRSIANVFNQSLFGLIFSAREGACYTSTEYLLCGLPVISTMAIDENGTGGREYWYDDYNSIISSPDVDSVFESAEKLLLSPRDPAAIRASCHAAMVRQRKYFEFDVLQPLFRKFRINEGVDYSLHPNMFSGTHREKHRILAEGSLKPVGEILEILKSRT